MPYNAINPYFFEIKQSTFIYHIYRYTYIYLARLFIPLTLNLIPLFFILAIISSSKNIEFLKHWQSKFEEKFSNVEKTEET